MVSQRAVHRATTKTALFVVVLCSRLKSSRHRGRFAFYRYVATGRTADGPLSRVLNFYLCASLWPPPPQPSWTTHRRERASINAQSYLLGNRRSCVSLAQSSSKAQHTRYLPRRVDQPHRKAKKLPGRVLCKPCDQFCGIRRDFDRVLGDCR